MKEHGRSSRTKGSPAGRNGGNQSLPSGYVSHDDYVSSLDQLRLAESGSAAQRVREGIARRALERDLAKAKAERMAARTPEQIARARELAERHRSSRIPRS